MWRGHSTEEQPTATAGSQVKVQLIVRGHVVELLGDHQSVWAAITAMFQSTPTDVERILSSPDPPLTSRYALETAFEALAHAWPEFDCQVGAFQSIRNEAREEPRYFSPCYFA